MPEPRSISMYDVPKCRLLRMLRLVELDRRPSNIDVDRTGAGVAKFHAPLATMAARPRQLRRLQLRRVLADAGHRVPRANCLEHPERRSLLARHAKVQPGLVTIGDQPSSSRCTLIPALAAVLLRHRSHQLAALQRFAVRHLHAIVDRQGHRRIVPGRVVLGGADTRLALQVAALIGQRRDARRRVRATRKPAKKPLSQARCSGGERRALSGNEPAQRSSASGPGSS